ncbi:MAG TPA: phosphoenolpyruvate carboxylase [Candidatus Limnocylindria bacterium]|nr:phosphoenolpyruvate carboxylase [Candidatus Limnocylindria bacterium]
MIVPRTMSTQHPDNVTTPFFATGPLLTADDEVREAYYAFSHLGCEEQMWDFEGKEVDEHVVEKLLSTYDDYFTTHRLGEDVFLTPRIPNPVFEPAQAKIVLEVLHSLPRHADLARLFYRRERPPILELIYPMTTSARDLDRVNAYYERFVAGMEHVVLDMDELPLGSWFGRFAPATIRMIPLIEDREHLLAADELVRTYLTGKDLDHVRVFIARSDPALNYGYVAAVLLALVALDRLGALEAELGIPIYPIIGVGSVPFRGGLSPATTDRYLRTYPSVQTATIQSAFKYDHPMGDVRTAIEKINAHRRTRPLPVAADTRTSAVLERVTARYQSEVAELAEVVNRLAPSIPRRRLRKLHVGLFGYSRESAGLTLPRAIPFCASLYSLGLPPEVLGLAAVDDSDWTWLCATVPELAAELRDAIRFLDPDGLGWWPSRVRESVDRATTLIGDDTRDPAHAELAGQVRRAAANGSAQLGDLVLRAASVRRFLG